MPIDYSAGLALSLWLCSPFALCAIAAITHGFIRSIHRGGILITLAGAFAALPALLTVLGALWVGLFALANLFCNSFWTVHFVGTELKNGMAVLRFSTVLLAYRCIASWIRTLQSFDVTPSGYTRDGFRRLVAFEGELEDLASLSWYRNVQGVLIHTLAQNGFYVLIASSVWCFRIVESTLGVSVEFAIHGISVLLLFIADDWAVMARYYVALKGRMFSWHFRKVTVVNYALSALLMTATWQEFGIVLAFAIGVTCLSIMLYCESSFHATQIEPGSPDVPDPFGDVRDP